MPQFECSVILQVSQVTVSVDELRHLESTLADPVTLHHAMPWR